MFLFATGGQAQAQASRLEASGGGRAAPGQTPTPGWVDDALCVHSGWHYTHTRISGKVPEYILFGRGHWRTWNVSDLVAGGSGEGGWDAANPPYGGGMQMDYTFQSSYGSEYVRAYGNAGRWPVSVQILVSFRGWLVQGWGAWPNTSRACGLR